MRLPPNRGAFGGTAPNNNNPPPTSACGACIGRIIALLAVLTLHRALGGPDDLRGPEEVQAVPDVEEPDDHVQPPVGRPPQLARQPQVDQAQAITPNAGKEEGEREKQRVGVVGLARTLAGRLEEPAFVKKGRRELCERQPRKRARKVPPPQDVVRDCDEDEVVCELVDCPVRMPQHPQHVPLEVADEEGGEEDRPEGDATRDPPLRALVQGPLGEA
mmetsp:Transcript_16254/g.52955  ORF Transcript_16254/g.52955 Transcript_16254/m.52955 type:complete len:217 (-) Transcript_16254:279-929(-)